MSNSLLNERMVTKNFIDVLVSQEKIIYALVEDIDSILHGFSNLEMKYNRPIYFYWTREFNNYYQKEPSELTNLISLKLNEWLYKETGNKDLCIKFNNIKNLTYSIYSKDIEIVRFSLTRKKYIYLNSIIYDVNELNKNINSYNKSSEILVEDIKKLEEKLLKYKETDKNIFLIFKEIKTFKNFFQSCKLLLTYSKTKKQLLKLINEIELRKSHCNDLIKNNEDSISYMNDKFKFSKEITCIIDKLFNENKYEIDNEKYNFYY